MPIAKIHSRALLGIHAPAVTVEAHVAPGLPAFTLVGLPETAVRESRDRVRAAILSSGFEFPPRRLTVNLAPADLPKESARFDLAIALAILEVIAPGYIFLGFAIGALFMGAVVGLGLAGFSLPWALVVFAVLSLVAFVALRRLFGIRNGQVKYWDRDIND